MVPADREKEEPIVTSSLLEELLAAAKAHGDESEPDHEVGDLLGLIASCWQRLTPDQQREVYGEHQEMIAEWLPDR
jgi:hypothetical protein